MSFERDQIARAVARHGRVARVVVARALGSAPREPGASMLVWAERPAGAWGQEGTIGGGTLEHEAAQAARGQLARAEPVTCMHQALGPDLGQCCGGAVTLVSEVFDADSLGALPTEGAFARPVTPEARAEATQPLAVRRLLARARDRGEAPGATLVEGWLVEPLARPRTPVWIWGAGHVGRALVSVLAPLPELAITWLDTGPERFPHDIPDGVTPRHAADLPPLMAEAPGHAHHLILTYSHALDLALCEGALARGFASAGLIGSATKWARFRSRLARAGHHEASIARITCPIGEPALGKHPQAIALGVATRLLRQITQGTNAHPEAPDARITPPADSRTARH